MTLLLALITTSIACGLLITGATCWHAGYQAGRLDASAERHPANPPVVHERRRRPQLFDQDVIAIGGRRG